MQALAGMVTQQDLDVGRVYPPLSTIREVSTRIATNLVEYAYRNNVAGEQQKKPVVSTELLFLLCELSWTFCFKCYCTCSPLNRRERRRIFFFVCTVIRSEFFLFIVGGGGGRRRASSQSWDRFPCARACVCVRVCLRVEDFVALWLGYYFSLFERKLFALLFRDLPWARWQRPVRENAPVFSWIWNVCSQSLRLAGFNRMWGVVSDHL